MVLNSVSSSFGFLLCFSFPALPGQQLIVISVLDSEASSPALLVASNLQ